MAVIWKVSYSTNAIHLTGTLFDTSASALSREANLSRAGIKTKAFLRFNNHMTHNLLSSLLPQIHLIFLWSVCCSNAVSAVSPACAVCARGTGRGRWTFYKWDKCRDIVPALWHTDWHSWQMPDIVATMGTLCRFLPDCRGVAWPGPAGLCTHGRPRNALHFT